MMPQRYSILHLFAPAMNGGLEKVVAGLAAGHARRGHRVHVGAILSPESDEPPFLEDLRQAGVDVRTLRIAGRHYGEEIRVVRSICEALRPDVVHTHGYRSDIIDAWAARLARAKTVTTVHGFTQADWKNQTYQALQRIAARKFDAVVAVSQPIATRLRRYGVPRSRIHVVQNAFPGGYEVLTADEAAEQLGVARLAPRIGWVGRITRDKALGVLIEALHQLRDLEWQASVIGDGPELRDSRSRAEALGLADRIDWHGAVPEAGRFMKVFDVFVLSSRTEGNPIVLLEAMAAGIPVTVTSVGGVPDVVSEDEALIVKSEDPKGLAIAVRSILTNPAAASQRVQAATTRLADFGIDAWLDRYESIYSEVARPTY